MYENRRYLVIPTSLTSSIDFNEVMETSIETLRLSMDGTQTFVKYDITNGRPSIYSESYTEYTHDSILELLSSEEWTPTGSMM
jgi:hypothetical protein